MTLGFELSKVTKRFDDFTALTEVSFSIIQSEHLAIIGPSGCGKSTLLRLLAGLDAPSDGVILLGGEIISEPGRVVTPPHRRQIGMVFQDLGLWPNLTAFENVLLGLSGKKMSRQGAKARALEALAVCKIEALAKRRPALASGGQQQRIALARAIAAEPSFLFFDEPFSGLDLLTKLKLLDELAELAEKKNLTMVLVTHDPIEAITLCRAAISIDKGRVVEAGCINDLLADPKSETLKVFRDHTVRLGT
ncbi:MAG: ATP-binding cassette domain-containing protein [Deltaproteobacteria bacterium]|nr:ATP-binding cassette domain-containing protein [Deltaproteobacteria bacterium]